MLVHLLANSIDQIESALDGGWARQSCRTPDREKYRAEAAFAHSRNIDAAQRVVMTEIEILEEKSLRRIVVGIHHDRAEVNLVRAVGDVVGHSRSRKHGGEEQAGSKRGHNFHASENTSKPFRELRAKDKGVASNVAS